VGFFWKKPGAKDRHALQHILSRGRNRQIVWLDTEDLKAIVAPVPERCKE
jgi:hypothetical protein